MNEYYSDMLFLDMKPFTLLHRLGVNGKQSGSLLPYRKSLTRLP